MKTQSSNPSTKKINLNIPFLGMDSMPIHENGKQIKLGEILAKRIAYSSSNANAQKLMYIGFQLYEGKEIQLDPQDFSILKSFVESDEAMTNMVKYRILEQLV